MNHNQHYSSIEKTKRGMTAVVAFPDANGIETLGGLYTWQEYDAPNRTLFFAADRASAEVMLKTFK